MAVMTDPDRAACSTEYQQDASALRDVLAGLTKADIRAAVNAVDQWVNDNASAFNLAIPQPARANLTSTQKARLLVFVARKRYNVGA